MLTGTLARFFAALLLAGVPALAQSTWYVDDDGTPPGSGTIGDPYTSIDYAVAQQQTIDGDVILVASGYYNEGVDLRGKALTLSGDYQSRPVVDPEGAAGTAFLVAGVTGVGVHIDSFVVMNQGGGGLPGECEYPWECIGGAGLFIDGSIAFVDNCLFFDMSSSKGGAVKIQNSQVHVNGSEFVSNGASHGGAVHIYLSECSFDGCTFDRNSTGYGVGGAIHCADSGISLSDSLFTGSANPQDDPEANYGGALSLTSTVASIESCHFSTFDAGEYGGAILSSDSTLSLTSCSFDQARASQGSGGAIALGGSTGDVDNCSFVKCCGADGGAIFASSGSLLKCSDSEFYENKSYSCCGEEGFGGAAYCSSSSQADVRGCLFVGNRAQGGGDGAPHGGALYGPFQVRQSTFFANSAEGNLSGEGGDLGGSAFAVDCIFWGSWPNAFDDEVTAEYCDVQGGWPGEDNIDADPLFISAPDDLHLRHGSPCIDTGDPASELDDDGTRADMGAFPYTWTDVGAKYCSTHVNSSGLPASVRALGSSAIADNWLRLSATDVAKNQFGYYLMSTKQAYVPFFGGSSGVLCLGSPIVRFNLPPAGMVLFSGETGVMEFRPDLTGLPQNIIFQPGESWNFQVWFRDVVGGTFTSNTSDGVTVTWE